MTGLDTLLPSLRELYQDLHAHPELSLQETRTAALVASRLRAQDGWEVTEGVGGTGVVGVLRNGEGPTVLVRADMDGLPVLEATGLPYASVDRATDRDGNDVPTMHACGHDMHVTCLLGVTELLAAERADWRGTVVAVFQPAEETGEGARNMLDDGFAERFPTPDVCLGQHVGPFPTGVAVTRPGALMAASDSFRVRLFGRGGHGSSPESTVDPVVMAAAVVLRLQTVVSREVGASQAAVVTVGSIHSGTKENIIPDEAELKLNIRSVDPVVREKVLAAVRRVIEAEAAASGAPKPPEITPLNAFPLTVNTHAATDATITALREVLGDGAVLTLPHPINGSEDFGLFGTGLGAPSVFWHFGGADPAAFAGVDADTLATRGLPASIPMNHSPLYAPLQDPTIELGVRALLGAARAWLAPAV
ncbi:amidohydrolase [Streptomyces sp. VRA16 Mangrove soil]|uniref:amidohydrolase n=1 Tax=Streptomyces sp. VRA16 Mangrove soil TaxID=2817434 RepID=UPI001A9D0A90|nr:amidohydrolase [Streptomyces sp. VRA16 Mangrove soil]MBO1335055.1 amidohydrolase [Streptomyces sp. VRA16 Mangrove soil]